MSGHFRPKACMQCQYKSHTNMSRKALLRATSLCGFWHRPERPVQVDASLVEFLQDFVRASCHAELICSAMHFGILGSLVWRIDTREALDLALASLLVKTLGVACFHFLQWSVNEDLHEWQRRVYMNLTC